MRKLLIAMFTGSLAAMLITGCEWTSGGGVESWSDSYNWVNFSGVYNPASGSLIVSSYTDRERSTDGPVVSETVGTGSADEQSYSGRIGNGNITVGSVLISVGDFSFTDNGEGVLVCNRSGGSGSISYSSGAWSITLPSASGATFDKSESVGRGDAHSRAYDGVLSSHPVVSGSLTIETAGYSLQDNGAGTLENGDGASGSITYSTGAWSISLPAPIPGQGITATYQYTGTSGSDVDGQSIVATYRYTDSTAGNSTPGSSGGIKIYSFTVFQEGNILSIRDNTGATYEGNMGSVSSTLGSDGSGLVDGDLVTAQFTANGTSAAGVKVDMAGTFYAAVNEEGDAYYLTGRRIEGTWVEDNGTQGDIYGQAASVKVDDTHLYAPRTDGQEEAPADTTETPIYNPSDATE